MRYAKRQASGLSQHCFLSPTFMNNLYEATAKTVLVKQTQEAQPSTSSLDFSKYTKQLMSPQGLALAGGIISTISPANVIWGEEGQTCY